MVLSDDMATKYVTQIDINHFQRVMSDLTVLSRNNSFFVIARVKAGNLNVHALPGQERCIVYSARRGKLFIRKEDNVIVIVANIKHSRALLRNIVTRINNYFRDLPHG